MGDAVGVGEGLPGNEPEKLLRTDLQADGEPDDGIKFHIGLGPLHPADVISVDGAQLRQLLLGEMPFIAQDTDLSAEQNQGAAHA